MPTSLLDISSALQQTLPDYVREARVNEAEAELLECIAKLNDWESAAIVMADIIEEEPPAGFVTDVVGNVALQLDEPRRSAWFALVSSARFSAELS